MRKYHLRPLCGDDSDRGYFDVLNELAPVDSSEFTNEAFASFVEGLGENHTIYVAVNHENTEVIASGTLFIEQKIIHGMARLGHIEDVVVKAEHRKNGIGNALIQKLMEEATARGCYKVSLSATDAVVPFYQSCGLRLHEHAMIKFL